jgi:hypothetical protein
VPGYYDYDTSSWYSLTVTGGNGARDQEQTDELMRRYRMHRLRELQRRDETKAVSLYFEPATPT